jgi:hypothetical protein
MQTKKENTRELPTGNDPEQFPLTFEPHSLFISVLLILMLSSNILGLSSSHIQKGFSNLYTHLFFLYPEATSHISLP